MINKTYFPSENVTNETTWECVWVLKVEMVDVYAESFFKYLVNAAPA